MGRVAAIVAQGGGDIGMAGQPQRADGEVAQAGHRAGKPAGARGGRVLGEGDVADVVQRLDAPMPAQVVRVSAKCRSVGFTGL
jgi:hypothetical protein